MKKISVILGVVTTLLVPRAFAAEEQNPAAALNNLTTTMIEELLMTAGTGAAHRPYASAKPLGVPGFDLGIDVTAIQLTDEFLNALAAATASAPLGTSILPLPKLNIRVGLPAGFDFGFTWFSYQGISTIGFDVQKGFSLGPVKIAGRASYTNIDLWFFEATTYTVGGLISFSMPVIDPYLGVGVAISDGSLDITQGQAASLPGGVGSAEQTATKVRLYFGLPFKLFVLRVAPEVGLVVDGPLTFGAKASIAI